MEKSELFPTNNSRLTLWSLELFVGNSLGQFSVLENYQQILEDNKLPSSICQQFSDFCWNIPWKFTRIPNSYPFNPELSKTTNSIPSITRWKSFMVLFLNRTNNVNLHQHNTRYTSLHYTICLDIYYNKI